MGFVGMGRCSRWKGRSMPCSRVSLERTGTSIQESVVKSVGSSSSPFSSPRLSLSLLVGVVAVAVRSTKARASFSPTLSGKLLFTLKRDSLEIVGGCDQWDVDDDAMKLVGKGFCFGTKNGLSPSCSSPFFSAPTLLSLLGSSSFIPMKGSLPSSESKGGALSSRPWCWCWCWSTEASLRQSVGSFGVLEKGEEGGSLFSPSFKTLEEARKRCSPLVG
mmetsp:Transcript_47804/g.89082  ORF Transcript_47804/g.89082 Transcript_47804/m.89082 type:complete len:218 (-) Transcript_47804:685-1338(-)